MIHLVIHLDNLMPWANATIPFTHLPGCFYSWLTEFRTRKKCTYKVNTYANHLQKHWTNLKKSRIPPKVELFLKRVDLEKSLQPGCCSSVNWVLACRLKGHQFESHSGYMCGLWARSPAGGMREVTYQSFSHILKFLSLLSPLKVNFKKSLERKIPLHPLASINSYLKQK